MARSLYGGRLEQVGVNVGTGNALTLAPNSTLPTLYDGPLDDVGRVAVNDFLLDNDNDGIFETAVTTIPTDAQGIPRFFMGPDNVRPLYDLAGHAMLPTEVSAVGAVPAASESTAGISEISSDAEADTGTDHLTQMTPKQVKRRIDAHNVSGTAHADIRADIATAVAGGITDGSIVNAKLADQPQATFKGRAAAAGTGVPVNLTKAQALTILNVVDGATANDTDANLKARANHTGTQSADTITDGTTNKAFLATERTKLAGIATGATANVAATSSVSGTVELATDAEAITGTDTVRATTPANIAAVLAAGLVRLTTDQTIDGIKTFLDAPIVPNNSWTISDTAGLLTALTARQTMVLWNAGTNTWGARPTAGDAPFVVFWSTNDVDATPPNDPNLVVGDAWKRHPDAPPA